MVCVCVLSLDFSCSNYLILIWGEYLTRRIVSSQVTFSRSEIQSHSRLNFASLFFRLPRFHYSTIWRVANGLFNTDCAKRTRVEHIEENIFKKSANQDERHQTLKSVQISRLQTCSFASMIKVQLPKAGYSQPQKSHFLLYERLRLCKRNLANKLYRGTHLSIFFSDAARCSKCTRVEVLRLKLDFRLFSSGRPWKSLRHWIYLCHSR